MKFFFDTEFYEGKIPVKLFGYTLREINTIDLISIGIVSEIGEEYYAINKDCNLELIWQDEWLRKNVLYPIWNEHYIDAFGANIPSFCLKGMKALFNRVGKTQKQIGAEIQDFIRHNECGWADTGIRKAFAQMAKISPEFYAYYADYDWVVFCWIFGRMLDLPKGYPMYCRDLKQMMDDAGLDKEWKRLNCPDPENEHNALADAKWNLQLYKKIKFLK